MLLQKIKSSYLTDSLWSKTFAWKLIFFFWATNGNLFRIFMSETSNLKGKLHVSNLYLMGTDFLTVLSNHRNLPSHLYHLLDSMLNVDYRPWDISLHFRSKSWKRGRSQEVPSLVSDEQLCCMFHFDKQQQTIFLH